MAQRHSQSLDAMRQDAIRRSREMHRRAQPPPPPPPMQMPPQDELPPPPPMPPPTHPKPQLADLSSLLGGLHLPEELHGILTEWDGEKMALAGLLYLLWKEGADPSLLLALAYILL